MRMLIYQPRISYFIGGGEIYPIQTAKFFSILGHNKIIKIYKKIKNDRHNFAHKVDINTYDKINHDLINKSLKIIDNNIRYIFKDEYKKEYENIYNNLNEILIRKLWGK